MLCQIETTTYSVNYNGGAYQGTQNIQPIAVGHLRNGTKVLIARNHLTGELKCLDWGKVSHPRRVSRQTITIERPDQYLTKLRTIESEGVPASWLNYTTMPPERVLGFDPVTRVVDTIPYSFALWQ